MTKKLFITAVILTASSGGHGNEICENVINDAIHVCQHGCCGNDLDPHCCQPSSPIVFVAVGAVLFLFVALLISAFCYKKMTKHRRVVLSHGSYPEGVWGRTQLAAVVSYEYTSWRHGRAYAPGNRPNLTGPAIFLSPEFYLSLSGQRQITASPYTETVQTSQYAVTEQAETCTVQRQASPPPYTFSDVQSQPSYRTATPRETV